MAEFWRFLHLAGVIVWVGGMFFTLVCLRPAVADLQPQQRPGLMVDVLRRFFTQVWIALLAIWVSGVAMLMPYAVKDMPLGWFLMMVLGTVMTLVFMVIRLVHFSRAQAQVARADLPGAGLSLERIRGLVKLNLILGVVTVASVKLLVY